MQKLQFFCFGCLFILLQSCFPGAPAESIQDEAVELAGTKWSFINRNGLQATIEFNEDLTQVKGTDGCNEYTADLELKNYLMQLSKFVSTEMYCEDLDDLDRDFLVALSKVRDYNITSNRLNLYTLGYVYIGNKSTGTLKFNLVEQ